MPINQDASQLKRSQLEIRYDMPKLVSSNEEFQSLVGISDKAQALMTATNVMPFAVQFVIKGFMSKLWQWIDMMQIFTSLTFLQVNMPENVLMI